jgi:uncharacterized phage-like protein YoqJ
MKIAIISDNKTATLDYRENETIKTFIDDSIKSILKKFKRKKGVAGLSGLTIGTEQHFCHICKSLKIPYDVYIPFEGHELSWPKPTQENYRLVLNEAEDIIFSDYGNYNPKKIQSRDELLIGKSSVIIVVWDGRNIGRAFESLVHIQRSKGKRKTFILNIKELKIHER